MEYQEFCNLFTYFSSLNNLTPPNCEQMQRFFSLTNHLLSVNQVTNLTAIRDVEGVITKHYIDSLFASEFILQGTRVLDIGCGPGFPTLPLAIMRPDLQIVSLDSTQKKIDFVASSAKLLDLNNVTAISARAEDHEVIKKLGSFDVVTSRAVARLNVLCELALPYTKINGTLLALKAAKTEEELSEARNAIKTLGGGPTNVHTRNLRLSKFEAEDRTLIEIPKLAKTPAPYPRPFAAIKKKPL